MADKPYLTVGMATYQDPDSLYFVLQSLRMYHDLSEVELLVIDNHPGDLGKAQDAWMNMWLQHGTAGVRYIPFHDKTGTAAPRNEVFKQARGEVVLCMDSHVLLRPNTLDKLMAWFRQHPDSRDLVTGPLLYDNQKTITTCFADVWRGEMWGIWANAWQHRDGGPMFWVHGDGEDNTCNFYTLEMGPQLLSRELMAELRLPSGLPWSGHESMLEGLNLYRPGESDDDEFDIPGMGLGLFACRKAAWLGFNENFRGFGGEEMYIHEKFRQSGHRCLSLGFLKWLHKFARPGGVKYPLRRWDKCRNYVIGLQELQMPLDDCYKHWVGEGLMPEHEWKHLLSDPIGNINPPTNSTSAGGAPPPPTGIDGIFDAVQRVPRDMEQHMPALAEMASRAERVTDISGRRESFIALAKGRPGQLTSYNSEKNDVLYRSVANLAGASVSEVAPENVSDIDETDLLFLDEWHSYATLKDHLATLAPKVTRQIVLHDTVLFGTSGPGGTPGMGDALREFCEASGGEWFVAAHTAKQHGLTTLSRDPADRPAKTLRAWPHGPGSELKKMLASLGVNPGPSCDCNAKAKQMDAWGVEGCKQNRETIIGWMRDGQGRWGWRDKVHAAAAAVTSGLAFKLNPLDPFPGIIDEAIKRAEDAESLQEAAGVA